MSPAESALVLALSLGLAVRSFAAIVRGYRRLSGFPWAAALAFAAAALLALFGLRSLIGP